MTPYLQFKALHHQTKPLLLGNVWSVQSASAFERLGFQAIGTSSAALAKTLGYNDGQETPFEELLYIVNRIIKIVSLPLTVDIEFGYGETANQIAENIVRLAEVNVAGINIEDSHITNGERKLRNENEFAQTIDDVVYLLKKQRISVFLNVRCDAILLNNSDGLETAKTRARLYEQAGADGIFLPCIIKEADIKEIVSHTTLPLNVMCMPQLPDFLTLERIGVKRISMGNFLFDNAYTSMENAVTNILKNNTFSNLF